MSKRTPTPKKFLLDANVFIEAKRRYYAFSLCPGFWDCLVWHYGKGRIQSIDRVLDELSVGRDDLTQWVSSKMPKDCFASTDDADVIQSYAEIISWAQNQHPFRAEAKSEFASKADAWLIAYAKAKHYELVTHEVFAPDAHKKVPAPNVCKAFDIPYTDTFEMLKSLKVEFTWKPGM